MYLIFILCTGPQNNGAIPIIRRMREQHESDEEASDDEDDRPGDADESISADICL